MPKLKSKSSAKKRFSATSSGKIRRNFACKNHMLRRRSQSMKRTPPAPPTRRAPHSAITNQYLPSLGGGRFLARVKGGVTAHARHKKILGRAKGYRGRSNNCFRIALEKVEKALQYAYRDRRVRKRNFRALWIQRINAAARLNGLTYAKFMHGLSRSGVELDRKVLADLAVREPEAFKGLVEKAQSALAT